MARVVKQNSSLLTTMGLNLALANTEQHVLQWDNLYKGNLLYGFGVNIDGFIFYSYF